MRGHPQGGEPGVAPVGGHREKRRGVPGQQKRGPWSSGLVTEQKLQWGKAWTPRFSSGVRLTAFPHPS